MANSSAGITSVTTVGTTLFSGSCSKVAVWVTASGTVGVGVTVTGLHASTDSARVVYGEQPKIEFTVSPEDTTTVTAKGLTATETVCWSLLSKVNDLPWPKHRFGP